MSLLSQLKKGGVYFPLPLARFRFSGKALRNFFQGILSNDIHQLSPGKVLTALHLSPKGKWVAGLRLFQKGDAIDTVTSVAEGSLLKGALKNYLFLSEVSLEDLSASIQNFLISGNGAYAWIQNTFETSFPSSSFSHHTLPWQTSEVEVLQDQDWVFPTFLLSMNKEKVAPLTPYLENLSRITEAQYHTLRLESKIPMYGKEIDENTLPPEVIREEDYLSYTKGCYVGQETISRIKHYGKVNRLLAQLRWETKDKVAEGSAVLFQNKEIGKITSVGQSFDENSSLGLALLPRPIVETKKEVDLQSSACLLKAQVGYP